MYDTTQSYGPASNNVLLARPGQLRGAATRAASSPSTTRSPACAWWRRTSARMQHDHGADRGRFLRRATDRRDRGDHRSPRRRCGCGSSTCGWRRRRSTCWSASTTISSPGAAQGFYQNSVAFLGVAGEIYHRNPQVRLSQDLDAGDAAGRPGAGGRAPGAARLGGARSAGRAEAGLERVAWRRRAGLRPSRAAAAGDRRVRIGAAVRGRRVPDQPGRSQDRLRLGAGGQCVRAGDSGAQRDRQEQRAVADRRIHDRHGNVGPVHRVDRRRAVSAAAGSERRHHTAAALPAQHRQRHRHVRRQRQLEDHRLARLRHWFAVLPADWRRPRLGRGDLLATRVGEHPGADARGQPRRRLHQAAVLRRQPVRDADAGGAARVVVPADAADLRRLAVQRPAPRRQEHAQRSRARAFF